MKAHRVERKLSAIFAADVEGYSRLMGRDEVGTLRTLTAYRVIIDRLIASHRGRIFNTAGDSLVTDFASAVDAVQCAVEVQEAIGKENADRPAGEQMRFRIGIHVGDIIVQGDNLFGDAVNVAARLEALAEPGGICVSRVVRDQIRDKLPYRFEDMGEQSVKNIARPVRVYALSEGRAGLPLAVVTSGNDDLLIPPKAPSLSIVVLPFTNLSNDPEQDYLAEAITEDLTTDLSRIADSFVISRNTAFTYKGKPVDVRQIGRELGVRYILEGSVRRTGDQVRVNVQLIDAENGAHLWADRFDASRIDLDQAQDEIIGRLAHTLNRELVVAAVNRIERQAKTNPDARDFVMRGWAWWHRPATISARQEARQAFDQALAMDRESINAKIGLAATITQILVEGWSSSFDHDQAVAERLLHEVLERDAHHPMARAQMGLLRRVQNRLSEAQAEVEMAIALDRNSELALKQLGQILLFQGEPLAAIPHLEKAIRLNPRGPNLWSIQWPLGQCYLLLGQVDAAIDLFRKACAASPRAYFLYLNLAGALGLRGDLNEARGTIAEAIRLKPEVNSLARYRAATPWITNPKHWSLREKTLNLGLRRAGFPDE
ncbi:MAG TPA: adenylate/guanylate cyclase domain-containing protein [Steroidobacteraceae bacterium]|nr:adenylate/guanylate cyclase domain-containing protein [Steroidobacteraceae bacterium]